jgi:hypothetical protein
VKIFFYPRKVPNSEIKVSDILKIVSFNSLTFGTEEARTDAAEDGKDRCLGDGHGRSGSCRCFLLLLALEDAHGRVVSGCTALILSV